MNPGSPTDWSEAMLIVKSACNHGRKHVFETIQMLIDAGADVNYSHYIRKSPLRIALDHKNIELLNILLENGYISNVEIVKESLFKSYIKLKYAN